MSGTGSYELLKIDNKTILSFNSKDVDNKYWYLPNCDSIGSIGRQIAIESDVEIGGKEDAGMGYRPNTLQTGQLQISSKSRYKIVFKLMVNSEQKSYILLCPSWGRWLKKPSWLIIGTN